MKKPFRIGSNAIIWSENLNHSQKRKPVFSLRAVIYEFFQKKFKHTRSYSFSNS